MDHRLLAMLAEVGRIPLHDLAARAGMDPRDVAFRLATMGLGGLPVSTVVEADPVRIRQVLATAAPAPGSPHGWVGTPLFTPGPYGGHLGVRVIEVQDPADQVVSSPAYPVRAGYRAVLVTVELYNHGPLPLQATAAAQLCLVAQDGATMPAGPQPPSHPPPPTTVLPGQLVRGSVTYVIAVSRPVAAVRWHNAAAGFGLPVGALTWQRPGMPPPAL